MFKAWLLKYMISKILLHTSHFVNFKKVVYFSFNIIWKWKDIPVMINLILMNGNFQGLSWEYIYVVRDNSIYNCQVNQYKYWGWKFVNFYVYTLLMNSAHLLMDKLVPRIFTIVVLIAAFWRWQSTRRICSYF